MKYEVDEIYINKKVKIMQNIDIIKYEKDIFELKWKIDSFRPFSS